MRRVSRRRAARGPAPRTAASRPARRSRTRSSEPKRRGSLSASRCPSSVSITRWSCLPISAGIDPPAPRHAEVEDQRVAAVGVDQPIFGAPAEPGDPRPGQPLAKVDRETPGAGRRGAARPARAARPSSTCASPRTVVSTSGSSGMRALLWRSAAQLPLEARSHERPGQFRRRSWSRPRKRRAASARSSRRSRASYDVMNDSMSGGMHRLWKDRFVAG